jgi:4-hydroxyphenylpyruvate dioxygenase-like putative hemolysin
MGEPVAGAEFLLKNFLAPAGSGRQATLLSVDETADAAGRASYRLAYTIERGDRGVPLQAIAIIAQGRATLVTMTVVAPVETWKTDFAPKLYKMADSFRLTTS